MGKVLEKIIYFFTQYDFEIKIHETIGNRCWVRLSPLTSTSKRWWVSMHEEVDLCWSRPSFSWALEHSSRATPLGRLYTGPFPLCWKQSGLLHASSRRRWKRSSTNRWPIPDFSVCSSTNLQLEKIDDAFAHTLWGNKKRANYYYSRREKNFHFALFNLSQKVRLFRFFIDFAWQLWKSMIFFWDQR